MNNKFLLGVFVFLVGLALGFGSQWVYPVVNTTVDVGTNNPSSTQSQAQYKIAFANAEIPQDWSFGWRLPFYEEKTASSGDPFSVGLAQAESGTYKFASTMEASKRLCLDRCQLDAPNMIRVILMPINDMVTLVTKNKALVAKNTGWLMTWSETKVDGTTADKITYTIGAKVKGGDECTVFITNNGKGFASIPGSDNFGVAIDVGACGYQTYNGSATDPEIFNHFLQTMNLSKLQKESRVGINYN